MNTAIDHWSPNQVSTTALRRIIIIGAGPVGVRLVEELRRKQVQCQLLLFGNEPYDLYNRVQLSHLLSRNKDYTDIVMQLPDATADFQLQYQQQQVTTIIPHKKVVATEVGDIYHYDHLIIATGSKPHIPIIDGVNLKGVYSFRNMRDAEMLLARSFRSRRIVVIGGGLLGLEAARALARHHTQVILVQQSDRLMNRQLDIKASEILEDYVKRMGIRVITGAGVRKIIGDQRVEAVVTRDGGMIACDTVLFCAGIKPEISLATNAGLHVGRGITVNDQLQTSHENIYAIGECCEHKGMIYGIVAPGFEQAAVVADCLAGGKSSYQGTQLISTLKVVGKPVCSMGEVAEVTRRAKQSSLAYQNKKTGEYRKLIIHQGRVVGACAIGDWPENRRIQEAFLTHRYLFPWQRLLFLVRGRLWLSGSDVQVAQWPEAAIVCQCNQITRGTISAAIAHTCNSVSEIGKQTSEGMVCGSCQPLLQSLLGIDNKPLALQGAVAVFIFSLFAITASILLIVVPGIQPVNSVQISSWEFLWTSSYWKQVTGFSLLALISIGLLMSLRKRAGIMWLGRFSYWRIAHTFLGLLALVVLLLHTGAHLGENINQWLMINFLAISAVGALAGISISWSAKTSDATVRLFKKIGYWLHVLVSWPLPGLLAVHIVSVYFF